MMGFGLGVFLPLLALMGGALAAYSSSGEVVDSLHTISYTDEVGIDRSFVFGTIAAVDAEHSRFLLQAKDFAVPGTLMGLAVEYDERSILMDRQSDSLLRPSSFFTQERVGRPIALLMQHRNNKLYVLSALIPPPQP